MQRQQARKQLEEKGSFFPSSYVFLFLGTPRIPFVCSLVGRTLTADLCDSLRSHRPLTAVCVCRIASQLHF